MKLIKLFSFLFVVLNASFGVGQGNSIANRETEFNIKKNNIISTKSSSSKLKNKIKSERHYDSITNISTIRVSPNNYVKIIGDWNNFDFENYNTEVLMGHCPLFVNSENILLGIKKFNERFYDEQYKGLTDRLYLRELKQHLETNPDTKTFYNIIKSDIKENYVVYKILKKSYRNDFYIESYYLLGVKNDNVYRIVIYNFDYSQYENIEEFLVNIYKIN